MEGGDGRSTGKAGSGGGGAIDGTSDGGRTPSPRDERYEQVRDVLARLRDTYGYIPGDATNIPVNDKAYAVRSDERFNLDAELRGRHALATIFYPYLMKVVNIGCVFMAAYLARALFERSLNERLFMRQARPPSLFRFVATFLALHLAFYLLLALALAALLYFSRVVVILDPADLLRLVQNSLLDFVIVALVTIAMTVFLTNMVANKKYFRYRDEGHRALRALATLVPQLFVIVSLFPYYAVASNLSGGHRGVVPPAPAPAGTGGAAS